jgi:hypothetical protein
MLGQGGRAGDRWVAGVAGLLAVVLLAAVGVAALRTDTASAETVLARGADVVLDLVDGTSRQAVEGERVPRGATVRAGRTGAELQTRGREVHLGGYAAVTVLDGARQVLRAGFVMVEARRAPGLELRTDAGIVTSADGSLVRVDGGSLVRIGVLRGDAAAVRAVDRQATAEVPTYFQVQVPAGGLPGSPTPFVLTPGDEYERVLAADLVRADEDLNALASRLDSGGPVGAVVLTALRAEVPAGPVPASGAPSSEGALGFLLAQAASVPDADLAARYERVRELRGAGGSWGVVAAIVDAEVGGVGAALNALLEPGTVPVIASQPFDPTAALAGSAAGAGSVSDPGAGGTGPLPVSSPDPTSPPPPPGGGGGGGSPSPRPSPSSSVQPVTDVVEDVVETVRELISPSPSPSSTSRPALPAPLSSPAPLPAPLPPPPPLPLPPVDLGAPLVPADLDAPLLK